MNSFKIICECGCSLQKSSLNRHLLTQKHANLMELKRREMITCSCCMKINKDDFAKHIHSSAHKGNFKFMPSISLIRECMDSLFDERASFSDAEYIKLNKEYMVKFLRVSKFDDGDNEILHSDEKGRYILYDYFGDKQIIFQYLRADAIN